MQVGRFIARYRGEGEAPASDLARIRSVPGASVLDQASPRMLLLEGPEESLRAAVGALPGWVLTPEQVYSLPDPRLKPVRSPGRRGKHKP